MSCSSNEAESEMRLRNYGPHQAHRLWRKVTYPMKSKHEIQSGQLILLPYEIRDMIYHFIYTQNCVLDCGSPRQDKEQFYFKLFKCDTATTQAERANFLAPYVTCRLFRRELLDFFLGHVILRLTGAIYFEHLSRTLKSDIPQLLMPRVVRARIEDGSAVPRLFQHASYDVINSLRPMGFTNLQELYVRDSMNANWGHYREQFYGYYLDLAGEMNRWKTYRDTIKATKGLRIKIVIQVMVTFPVQRNTTWPRFPIEVRVTSGEDFHVVETETQVSRVVDEVREGQTAAQCLQLEELLEEWLQNRTELLNTPANELEVRDVHFF